MVFQRMIAQSTNIKNDKSNIQLEIRLYLCCSLLWCPRKTWFYLRILQVFDQPRNIVYSRNMLEAKLMYISWGMWILSVLRHKSRICEMHSNDASSTHQNCQQTIQMTKLLRQKPLNPTSCQLLFDSSTLWLLDLQTINNNTH